MRVSLFILLAAITNLACVTAKKAEVMVASEAHCDLEKAPSLSKAPDANPFKGRKRHPTAHSKSMYHPINIEEPVKYEIGVLAIAYYPIAENGTIIDPDAKNGQILVDQAKALKMNPQKYVRDMTRRQVDLGINFIQLASRYQDGPPSVSHKLYKFIERVAPTPVMNNGTAIDVKFVLKDFDLCRLVEEKNVQQVWMFDENLSVSSPYEYFIQHPGQASPWNAPVCKKSYTLIRHTISRWDLFLHVWGHSLERKMLFVQAAHYPSRLARLFSLWQGPCDYEYYCYPLGDEANPKLGRCGNVHNAPNAAQDYDIVNRGLADSDCENWKPEGGKVAQINCEAWGCQGEGTIESNETVNYMIWNLQHMPGENNQIAHVGRRLRNWWDIYANYDEMLKSPLGFFRE